MVNLIRTDKNGHGRAWALKMSKEELDTASCWVTGRKVSLGDWIYYCEICHHYFHQESVKVGFWFKEEKWPCNHYAFLLVRHEFTVYLCEVMLDDC